MWLLDADTLKLVDFIDDSPVKGQYAILSHTRAEEEVSFALLGSDEAKKMKGWSKIELTCRRAKSNGLKYAWVDTCCINKDSSAESSEAINSMFRWYQNSKVCYAYLSDWIVEDSDDEVGFWSGLAASRWFTRGWTLQELIAPPIIVLYDHEWHASLRFSSDMWEDDVRRETSEQLDRYRVLADITGIDYLALGHKKNLAGFSNAQRLSWAAHRCTTRPEDKAYCLLGILGVNMPLLYGEGDRAFMRLQEELLRTSNDLSILCGILIGMIRCDFFLLLTYTAFAMQERLNPVGMFILPP